MLFLNKLKGTNMGKTSKPSYSSGVVNINGEEKASHYKKGNTVYSNYNMSDREKKIYDYAQNSFLENLPNINVFSDETQKSLQNQLNAYTQKGLQTINDFYTPMLSNLKNDIASRFGNFDNSIFMDNLSDIESNRADAMSALTQDILAKQNELYNDELNRRYNYLNFLGNVQNQSTANIMNYLQLAANNSSSGNAYNQYAASTQSSSPYKSYANTASALLSSSGNPYAMAAGAAIKLGSEYFL